MKLTQRQEVAIDILLSTHRELTAVELVDYKVEEAIDRENKIKGGSRNDKENLINSINPSWKDLWEVIQEL